LRNIGFSSSRMIASHEGSERRAKIWPGQRLPS
jgi:hypothetical protein